jgi:hypothetical protein
MNPRTIALSFSAAILGGMFLFAAFNSRSFGRGGEPMPAPLPRPVERSAVLSGTPVRLSAGELWGQYRRDAAAADRKYKDKLVAVTGTVAAVARDFHGNVVVQLTTGDVFETVRATLATRDAAVVTGIFKGQSVSVTCLGSGALIGAPILENCALH